MKKEILNALKVKFPGVADSILDRIAEKLAKTVTTEEQVKEVVEAYTIQQLIESNGDYRATEAQQTAVKNYEKKYGLREGKAIEAEGGDGTVKPKKGNDSTPDETTPEWAKSLIEQNKALTERLNRIDSDRLLSSRRTKLETVVSKLPESLRKAYSRVSLEGTDEEFGSLIESITAEVSGIADSLKAKGTVFGIPVALNTGGDKDNLTESQLKAISDRGAGTADDQPF